MSSEAITRNDLTAILNEVLPPKQDMTVEEVLLSSTARLVRIGKFRTLVLNGYQTQENVILAVDDRPNHQVEAIFWANYNGKYWKSGNVAITTSGTIGAWVTTNYNADTYQSALGSTENIISTLTWVVP